MTWGEAKIATLQKMFAIPGGEILRDENTKPALAAMPCAANEGLQLLATAGKWLVRQLEIVQNPAENLLPETGLCRHEGGVTTFASTAPAYAWYFEAQGSATAKIVVPGQEPVTVKIEAANAFAPYSGLVYNPGAKPVSIEIEGPYACLVRGVALYARRFKQAEQVPACRPEQRYHLRSLAPDFYRLKPGGLLFEGEGNAAPAWRFEGDDILVLPAKAAGSCRVFYYAYPAPVTAATPDAQELPLTPEAAALLPLYMASQLHKDDDLALATVYRNEFEIGLERLGTDALLLGHEEFESGWV